MKVLIIEDELVASNRIKKMVLEYDPDTEVLAQLDSVLSSVEYLSNKENKPDVIFMDIQLGDGLSFEIFENVSIDYPIIFTTAYNEYAINAFKVNSIDYLLKPISQEDLNASLDKLKKFQPQANNGNNSISGNGIPASSEELQVLLSEIMQQGTPRNAYKNRFLVKYARGFKSIETSGIAYMYSEDKITFLVTKENEKYILDHSLEDLSKMLNPAHFYKISRQFIVAMDSIKDIQNHFNSRLKLSLEPHTDKEVFVSRSQVSNFKNWLDN